MKVYELSGIVTVSCSATIEASSIEEAMSEFTMGNFECDHDGEPFDISCEKVEDD